MFVSDHNVRREFSWENRFELKFSFPLGYLYHTDLIMVLEYPRVARMTNNQSVNTCWNEWKQVELNQGRTNALRHVITWSVVNNSVRYHVMPRLAKRRWMACWMEIVEWWVRMTAEVESGKRKRQNRDPSIGANSGFSYERGEKKEDRDEQFVRLTMMIFFST